MVPNLVNTIMLLNKDTAVNAQGGRYGNAVQAAFYQCHKVVELLLNKDADVSAQSGLLGGVLRWLQLWWR
jgi:hypothetical protein